MNSSSNEPQRHRRAGRRRLWPTVSLLASLTVLGGAAVVATPPDARAQEPVRSQGIFDPLFPDKVSKSPAPSSSEPPTSSSAPTTAPSEPSSSAPPPSVPPLLPPPPAPSQPHLPTADPAPGDVEPGPGRAWTLTSSRLTLIGTHYHGYEMREVNGKQVKTMHFTVDKLKIKDLVQRGKLGNGKNIKAESVEPGLVSTVTEGPIDLYTQKLTGTLNVLGYPVVPVTLSPDSLLLPNLDLSFLRLPKLTFTDAVVHNVKLGGGNLFIPDAKISLK